MFFYYYFFFNYKKCKTQYELLISGLCCFADSINNQTHTFPNCYNYFDSHVVMLKKLDTNGILPVKQKSKLHEIRCKSQSLHASEIHHRDVVFPQPRNWPWLSAAFDLWPGFIHKLITAWPDLKQIVPSFGDLNRCIHLFFVRFLLIMINA